MVSKNARMNVGIPGELPVLFQDLGCTNPINQAPEEWAIFDRGTQNGAQRWKLCAMSPVTFKANYSLIVKNRLLYTSEDGSVLKVQRPDLFAIVSGIAASGSGPVQVVTEDIAADPYGDMAINRGATISAVQEFNRSLLKLRENELHWRCRPDIGEPQAPVKSVSWELAVRQIWYGIFRGDTEALMNGNYKGIRAAAELSAQAQGRENLLPLDWQAGIEEATKVHTSDMNPALLQASLDFIGKGNPKVDFKQFNAVIKDYYAGRYKPDSCMTLERKFDELTSADFDVVDPEYKTPLALPENYSGSIDLAVPGKDSTKIILVDRENVPEPAASNLSDEVDSMADFM